MESSNKITNNESIVSPKTKKKNNNLGLIPQFDRHPSAQHIQKEIDDKLAGKANNIEEDFFVIKETTKKGIILQYNKNTHPFIEEEEFINENNKGEDNKVLKYNLILNKVEHQIIDNDDYKTFYIKNNKINDNIDNNCMNKYLGAEINSNKKAKNNKLYSFSPHQQKLDQEITSYIQKGKNYKDIEKKLEDCLIDCEKNKDEN